MRFAIISAGVDGQALVLIGPESLTQRRQVECIGRAVGRPIHLETISEDADRACLGNVIPPAYVNLFIAQWRDEVGVPSQVTGNVERICGRPAAAYASWVARNADAFLAVP